MLDLSYPVVDGIGQKFLQVPGSCWLDDLKFRTASLNQSAVFGKQDRTFVLCFIFVILHLTIAVELKSTFLAHEEPVYFSQVTKHDRLININQFRFRLLAFLFFA